MDVAGCAALHLFAKDLATYMFRFSFLSLAAKT